MVERFSVAAAANALRFGARSTIIKTNVLKGLDFADSVNAQGARKGIGDGERKKAGEGG